MTLTRDEYPRILYVCTFCHEQASEICGYTDRNELRVMPDGRWLCDGCFHSMPSSDRNGDGCWSDFPAPPEYKSTNAQSTSSDGGGEARATAQRPAGTCDHLAGYDSGQPSGSQYRSMTQAETITGPAAAVTPNGDGRVRKDADVAPGPSETTPQPAQSDVVREALFGHVKTSIGWRRPTVDEVEERFNTVAALSAPRPAPEDAFSDASERPDSPHGRVKSH